MDKKIYLFIAMIFTFFTISGCVDKSRSLAGDSSGDICTAEAKFDSQLQEYIEKSKQLDFCGNLDKIVALKATAEAEGKTVILSAVNLPALFFAAMAKNIDMVTGLRNLEQLFGGGAAKQQKRAMAKVAAVAAKAAAEDISLAELFKAALNQDCMTQERFKAFIGLLEHMYGTGSDLLGSAASNMTIRELLGVERDAAGNVAGYVFDGYAQCFKDSDEFIRGTALPFLKAVDLEKPITDYAEAFEQYIRPKMPDCFAEIVGIPTAAEKECGQYVDQFWNYMNSNGLCDATLEGIVKGHLDTPTCMRYDDQPKKHYDSICSTPQLAFLRGMEVGQNTGQLDCSYLSSKLDMIVTFTGANIRSLVEYKTDYGRWLPEALLDYANSGRCASSCSSNYAAFGATIVKGAPLAEAFSYLEKMKNMKCNTQNAVAVCAEFGFMDVCNSILANYK
jgi:hypothetical protein